MASILKLKTSHHLNSKILKVCLVSGLVCLSGQGALAGEAVYFNDGNDKGCRGIRDGGPFNNALPTKSNRPDLCTPDDKATQNNRALFYDPNGGQDKSTSLTLGGELYVNSGRLGLGGANDGKIAIGDQSTLNNQASNGVQSIAMGVGVKASGASSVAIGHKANVTGEGAVIIGGAYLDNGVWKNDSVASGDNSFAVGRQAKATKKYAIAIGRNAQASQNDSIAIGRETIASGYHAIALGRKAQASGDISIALGRETVASGRSSIAMGLMSEAKGAGSLATGGAYKNINGNNVAVKGGTAYTDGSLALGTQTIAGTDGGREEAVAIGYRAIASQDKSMALGFDAKAQKAGSIAIGSNAVADVSSGVKGYDPLTGLATSETSGSWQSTESALSIGKKDGSTTRQIVGVAAGFEDTDAVNVAQLKKVATAANEKNYVHVNAGSAITDVSTLTADQKKNLDSVGGHGYALGTHAAAIGVKAKAIGNQSVAIGFDAKAAKTDSFALGEKSLANGANSLALGAESTTKTQYATAIGRATVAEGSGATAIGGGTGSRTSNDESGAFAKGAGAVAIGGGYSSVNKGARAEGSGAVAIGMRSLTTAKEGIALGADSLADVTAGVYGYDPLTGGVSTDGSGQWKSTKSALSVGNKDGSVTRQIIGVAAGSRDTDAVNVAQLKKVKDLGVYFSGDVKDNSATTNKFKRKLGQEVQITGGQTDANQLTDDNIGVVSDGSGKLSVKLAKDIKVNSVNAGTGANAVVIGSNGVQVGSGNSIKTYINSNGINANDQAITHVKSSIATPSGTSTFEDELNAAANDANIQNNAVNIIDLKNAFANINAGLVNKGLKFAANTGTVHTASLGSTVNIKGGAGNSNWANFDNGTNVMTQVSNGTVTVGLAKDLKDIKSTQYVKDDGTNSVKIDGQSAQVTGLSNTSLGNADFASNGRAATEEQINAAQNNLVSILGGNASNTNGNMSMTDIGGTGKNNIDDAIKSIRATANTASSGFTIGGNSVKAGTTDQVVKPTDTFNVSGATANTDFSESDQGGNIYTQVSDNQVTIGLAKDISGIDSVKTGNTTMNTNGVSITNGPSMTSTGINGGDKQIKGVKSGLDGRSIADIKAEGANAAQWNNAATVGDLTQVAGGVSNLNGVVGGTDLNDPTVKDHLKTYDVSGQTATNDNTVITAIKNMNEGGIKYFHTNDDTGQVTGGAVSNSADSSASGKYSTAIGYQASATAENALAIGKGAQATGKNSISIGVGNVVSGDNSGALGDPNVISGSGSYAVGNNNTIEADNAFVLGNDVTINANQEGAVVLGNQSTVESAHTGHYTVYGGADSKVAGQTGSSTQVVSVGRAGGERQIQNVAPGVVSANSTDAINGSQLYHSVNALNANVQGVYDSIGKTEKNANSGVASAMAVANLPQPHDPGKSMTSVAVGNYRDESALSFGMSTISDNGRWILKGSFTIDTQENRSYGAGVGFQW